jgi:hypothetical protein
VKILIHVDTNDYNEDGERSGDPNYTPEWSLLSLELSTFQQWSVAGQTGIWAVDGETFCGTAFECKVDYRHNFGLGDLLLRSLMNKIKSVCGDRLMRIWIDDLEVEWVEDMMKMRPEWIETMKEQG